MTEQEIAIYALNIVVQREAHKRVKARARAAAWRAASPENLERSRDKCRKWQASNKEKKRERDRLWAAKNQGKRRAYREKYLAANPEYSRNYRLKSDYGITLDEWNVMFESQGRRCAICRTGEPNHNSGGGGWATDHCHKTSLVRGILCQHCNKALGIFKDDIDTLRSAVSYLETSTGNTHDQSNIRSSFNIGAICVRNINRDGPQSVSYRAQVFSGRTAGAARRRS